MHVLLLASGPRPVRLQRAHAEERLEELRLGWAAPPAAAPEPESQTPTSMWAARAMLGAEASACRTNASSRPRSLKDMSRLAGDETQME